MNSDHVSFAMLVCLSWFFANVAYFFMSAERWRFSIRALFVIMSAGAALMGMLSVSSLWSS
jgi:hypothetical protein